MLNFLDGWSVGKVVPSVAVELGNSYSVGACIISRHSLVQLCGGDPSPLRGMNFTTRPREVRLEVMRCCGRLFVARSPSSQAALRPPGPLRTGRESFPSPSSSHSNASLEETRFRNGKTLTMNPVMALGMK